MILCYWRATLMSQQINNNTNLDIRSKLVRKQSVDKHYHDFGHRTSLPDLVKGDIVYVEDIKHEMAAARVEWPSDKPRSFRITLPTGRYKEIKSFQMLLRALVFLKMMLGVTSLRDQDVG